MNWINNLIRGKAGNPAVESNFTANWIRENNYRPDKKLITTLKNAWMAYAASIPPYPGAFNGKGIVICGGGYTYVTCAWVNISMLRKLGCLLPVELWYAGSEINAQMIREFEALDVSCKNCDDYASPGMKGFAMKPFAILHSSFKEVLFLDADNNCTADPASLFEQPEYLETGAIFWPDAWTTPPDNVIWEVIGREYTYGKEQESGQLLVNKEQCWRELNLCMYFNQNREYYYKMLLGDKDTFRFAWMALNAPYYMVKTPLAFCGFIDPANGFHGITMVQHDTTGNILFLHRNLLKWAQTQNDEVLWTHIKRMKGPEETAGFVGKQKKFQNGALHFIDMTGNVELTPFRQLLGGYELECLEILKALRTSTGYQEFLLDQCLVLTRAGYAENPARPLFEPLIAV